MRWPWRREGGRHAARPAGRAAVWAAPAQPPPDAAPVNAAPPPTIPADPVVPPQPAAVPATPPPPYDAVRLGFTDGSEVALAAADPNALALQAIARFLVQGRREPAETHVGATTARRTS